MMKADDKLDIDGDKQEFTNFEYLHIQLEVLKEQVEEITEILRYNNLERKETIVSPSFDDGEVFRRLEEEE